MQAKSTDELLRLWEANDETRCPKEELDAAQKILLARLGKLPKQKTKRVPVVPPRPDETIKWQFGGPILNSLPNDIVAGLFLVVVSCFFLVSVLASQREQNSKAFWEFTQTVTPTDVDHIEIQKLSEQGTPIEGTITVSDQTQIADFVATLKTLQPYQASHPSKQTSFKVTLSLRSHRTIEFEGYTQEGEGDIVFIGELHIGENFYTYGNGNAQFSTPEFYNWLVSVGFKP
jgi:hypothetical protein